MSSQAAFSNLHTVWAATVQEEARALARGADPPTTPLAFLLTQTAVADDVARGTLAALLLDLYESSVAWGAAPPNDWAALAERRAALFAGAEAALLAAKADHLPAVAAACGVENEYRAAILAGAGRSEHTSPSLASADWGLSVVVVDLTRDLAFAAASPAPTTPAIHAALTRAVTDARALISSSVHGSAALWTRLAAAADAARDAEAKASGRPYAAPWSPRRRPDPAAPLGGDDRVTLYEKAMARVTRRLSEVAAGVDGGEAALAAVLRARAPSPPSAPATPVATPRLGGGAAQLNIDDLLAGLDVAATEKGRTWAHGDDEREK